jgi:hypothetical protein
MNANTQNILSTFKGSDDNWIDEDDAPEFSDAELETLNMTLRHGSEVICEAKGLRALREKMLELKSKKQTIKIARFKQRGFKIRQQIAQMWQMQYR